MSALVDQLAFKSDALADSERFDCYRELYSGGADASCIGPNFRAKMVGCRLDRSILFERQLADVSHRRDVSRVRRDDFSHFTLTLNLAGALHADAGSGFRRIHSGEILLLDMSRPMQTRTEKAHLLTMSVARERIMAAGINTHRAHGHIIESRQAALLADHLRSLARHRSSLEVGAIWSLGRIMTDLLALAVGGSPARARSSDLGHVRQTEAIRIFVEQNLASPELNVETIMAATGVSRATLYRHFDQVGGIASYIRGRRLQELRRALSSPSETRSFAVLASAAGFGDEGVASRRFTEAFGMRPGQYRTTVRRREPLLSSRAQMVEWARELR